MTNPISLAFSLAGARSATPCPECPDDDALAAWCDRDLGATAARTLEDHALTCCSLSAVLGALAETLTPAETGPVLRVLLAIKGRSLALLNAADVTLRELTTGGAPAPALGALRGGLAQDGLISLDGPGEGLDALDVQVQSDGSLRLTVSGSLPEGPEGELRSILVEADGLPREKRPYNGEPIALGPFEPGSRYRVAVVARRPGQELRSLGEALLDLSA
ncbi:MAG: hypothetical protein DRQ55_08705 [Planctomycetota bacterium]|nr:MAG: hypothetical protein DRQ55_08705 [Planctomycetota bacterium]